MFFPKCLLIFGYENQHSTFAREIRWHCVGRNFTNPRKWGCDGSEPPIPPCKSVISVVLWISHSFAGRKQTCPKICVDVDQRRPIGLNLWGFQPNWHFKDYFYIYFMVGLFLVILRIFRIVLFNSLSFMVILVFYMLM